MKDSITVEQYADCSDSLIDANFQSPDPFPYAAGSTKIIAEDFSMFFT